MCGIAGLLARKGQVSERELGALDRMLDAEKHRGPDDRGTFHDGLVALGQQRLAIIDLSPLGRQPMSNEDQTVWLTFNGEIYNFMDLRSQLVGRHTFRSRTDSETLLHGYEEWGIEGLLKRLRGMFAFALYDLRKGCLFLVRDHFGIKPLYYSTSGDFVLFASEVRALMQSGMVRNDPNIDALIAFLYMGSVPPPLTTVKGVAAVPASHYVAIDRDGLRVMRYWSLGQASTGTEPLPGLQEGVRQTRALLEESVRLQLVSDVPLGVFLSGGKDSATLAALASRCRQSPITTLSVRFKEKEYDEGGAARRVAEQYHTHHHEVMVTREAFEEERPQILQSMDQPSIDGVNSYFISKAAAATGLKVVLSGLGGDEVFLGYDFYRTARQVQWVSKMPAALGLGLARLASSWGSRLGNLRNRPWERLREMEALDFPGLYMLFRGIFSPRQIQAILGIDRKFLVDHNPVPGLLAQALAQELSGPTDICEALSFLDLRFYMQSQLLKDTDVMSMRHSIEVRVPLLDHVLVQYVRALPTSRKLYGAAGKALLMEAMKGCLDPALGAMPKRGFTFPMARWLAPEKTASAEGVGDWPVLGGRSRWYHLFALTVLKQFADIHPAPVK